LRLAQGQAFSEAARGKSTREAQGMNGQDFPNPPDCPGPFGSLPSIQDWLLIAQVSKLGSEASSQDITKYLAALGAPLSLFLAPTSTLIPGVLVAEYPAFNLCGFLGTQNWQQWLAHVLGAKPISLPNLPGKGSIFMYYVALNSWFVIENALGLHTSKPFVFAGHSLGAATALFCGMIARTFGFAVQGVWGLAMPQAVDSVAAASIDFPVWKLSGTLDPVPLLPPEEVITIYYPAQIIKILRGLVPSAVTIGGYANVGDEACIEESTAPPGNIPYRSRCFYGPDVTFALAWLARTLGEWHIAGTYATWIKLKGTCADKQPGACGYAAPWILWDLPGPPNCGVPDWLNPQPSPVDPRVNDPVNLLRCQVQCT
jgi:Lipase (class 3)